MPSLVTHHHFAALVHQSAEPEIYHACDASPLAYRWGAQGPDILFFHNAPFGSRTALLGRQMHRKNVAPAFNALVRAAVRQKNPATLSYLLGFCTHYTLDRRTHPYILDTIRQVVQPAYGFSEDACHRLCEADLDAAVIERYISGEPAAFEAFRLLEVQPSVARVIGKLYAEIGGAVFGIDTSPAKVEGAMRTMRLVYTLLHGGAEGARAQVLLFERMLGQPGLLSTMLRPEYPLPLDLANTAHRVWHKPHVPDVPRTESFFELFEGAVHTAHALQRAIYACYYKGTAVNPLFFPSDYSGNPLASDTV